MVTKQEVKDHYATMRKDSNVGMCSQFVLKYLEDQEEDETGIFNPALDLFGTREYYTLDEVKSNIRIAIAQYIKDLQKVAEI